jgi:ATP-dependent RNA helicase RhlE
MAKLPYHAISFVTERDKWVKEEIEAFIKEEIPVLDLPPHLEVSTQLTEDKRPKVYMKVPPVNLPKKEERGASFHPKSAKNRKVNKRLSHSDEMRKKYGKPIKRSGKK